MSSSTSRGRRNHSSPTALPSTSRRSVLSPQPSVVLGLVALLALVLAAALVFWLLSSSRQPEPSVVNYSPDGRISFVRQAPDGKRNLFVVNPDGTGEQQVTHDIMVEGTNTWSPDGRRIIAQVSLGGVSAIIRMDVGPDNKSSNAVQLTADTKADSGIPSWSSDGSMITFQSKRDGGDFQIFVMDPNGNGKRRLSDGKGYAGQPAWSPDGKSIVYVAGDKPDPGVSKNVYIVPVAGGAPKKLTPGGQDLSRPQWSPDGKSILYLQNLGDRDRRVYIMDADGTNSRVLVNEGANFFPQFSPAGDKIAYYSIAPPSGSDIFIVPTSGDATSNLTHLTPDDYQPSWSPDGSKLVWSSNREGDYRAIVVGDADGSNQKVIAKGEGNSYQPEWGHPVK